jgi:hypothetical protein
MREVNWLWASRLSTSPSLDHTLQEKSSEQPRLLAFLVRALRNRARTQADTATIAHARPATLSSHSECAHHFRCARASHITRARTHAHPLTLTPTSFRMRAPTSDCAHHFRACVDHAALSDRCGSVGSIPHWIHSGRHLGVNHCRCAR